MQPCASIDTLWLVAEAGREGTGTEQNPTWGPGGGGCGILGDLGCVPK